MSRKPRSDAKLRNLPPEQKTALVDWLVDEGVSYKEAKSRLEERFGVRTSDGALADFWALECYQLRFRKARGFADQIVDTMREGEDAFDEATLKAVGQRAFQLAVAKEADVNDLATLLKIVGDTAKLKLQRDKLELQEKKAEQDAQKLELQVRELELKLQKVEAEEARRREKAEALKQSMTTEAKSADEVRALALAAVDEILLGKGAGK
ncbi:hypothetical protein H5P28_00270 [Ruficoccus amylovorans]|uniref:DUF3486 family protein n=1 Tax=Ruficoccus amylovorans TaxID=1804625 RepID=A0A842HAD4_9BACT|nr:hypothetical protein [Ruficoccus amylovorans]MBC2592686.1 hypothetical protein [Ruficoccus amylovorans]